MAKVDRGDSNATMVTEFILLGISDYPEAQMVMFVVFLIFYLATIFGNSLLIVLIIRSPLLHTPMYFFLCNLSFLDIFYTTSSIPQTLVNCFFRRPTISYIRCITEMYVSLFLGIAECFLLAVMAYDRFAAVCNPLHYTTIMSWKLCTQLAVTSWASAFMMTLIPRLLQPTQFCGHNVINHFTCELRVFLNLACSDIRMAETVIMINSVLVLALPFGFILVTYGRIGQAVLRIRSAEGRGKAFSTCGSHLVVVSIFYGSAISMYLRPHDKAFSNRDKIVSLFYGAVTPMLNPLIYSLRNKDVKGAFWRLLGKKMSE
ncbi:olfactory receptor 13H1-like [Eublepharis macularius]|uniref:Olfactory receptor n=1 Tax=Eublepharis macularius TaxID=481883 RepID=A0AA97KM99_EUBMA|nr:olfactory receptor 13H1-like [Eublepharis macularius]